MARWTLAGSVGVVAGPLVLAGSAFLGVEWRPVLVGLGLLAVLAAIGARRLPPQTDVRDERLTTTVRATLALLRRREVLRWLALLEAADLMLDVLNGFLALYLVDAVRASAVAAALGVAVWTGAGLVGDALLLVVLRHVAGVRYLRASALLIAVAYPAFLLLPGLTDKLVALAVLGVLNSGWYAIPKARLYETVGDRSGAAFALGTVAGVVGGSLPLVIGVVAGVAGLQTALWIPLAAPLALLVGLPRRGRGADG